MTRAQGPDTEIDYRVVGAPGAERLVVVLRTGDVAMTDPGPTDTLTRDIRVLLVRLDEPELDDPSTFGGETPAESTAKALTALIGDAASGSPVGLVGERDAAELAVAIAAAAPGAVDRLALVAAPRPATPLERDIDAQVLARVSVPTLLVTADVDDTDPAEDVAWRARYLADVRVEHIAAHELVSIGGRLALADVWAQVLDHVAPGLPRG